MPFSKEELHNIGTDISNGIMCYALSTENRSELTIILKKLTEDYQTFTDLQKLLTQLAQKTTHQVIYNLLMGIVENDRTMIEHSIKIIQKNSIIY